MSYLTIRVPNFLKEVFFAGYGFAKVRPSFEFTIEPGVIAALLFKLIEVNNKLSEVCIEKYDLIIYDSNIKANEIRVHHNKYAK